MLPDLNAGCEDWGHDSRHLGDPRRPMLPEEVAQATQALSPWEKTHFRRCVLDIEPTLLFLER